MQKIISVDLEITSYSLRAQLEGLLATHSEFRLKDWKDPNPPDLLFLELDEGNTEKTFAHIHELRRTSPDTEIFLTAGQADVNVLLEVIHAGVKEFFPQPLKTEQFEKALAQFKIRFKRRHQTSGHQGKIFSVIGSKGGVGTTTIAVNLGISFQQALKEKSHLLMDLNFLDGEIPLFLDVNPGHGLSSLSQNVNRLDATFLQSLITTHSSGLSLLPLGNGSTRSAPIPPGTLGETSDLLSSLFEYVIVDCGSGIQETNRPILERSFSIFVVTAMAAPALRKTKELLENLRKMDIPGCEITVVFNRHTPRASAPMKNIQEFLNIKNPWLIPNDYDAACRALNEGLPLSEMAPRGKLTKSIQSLAQFSLKLAGEQLPSKLPQIFNVFSRSPKIDKASSFVELSERRMT